MLFRSFLLYLDGDIPLPKPNICSFYLPEINGYKAGFSGATFTPDRQRIICTASVENTENWIDDGEIFGTFIGVINPTTLESEFIPIMNEDKLLNVKVESVTVCQMISEDYLHLYLITDGDLCGSELLKVSFQMRNGKPN